MKAIIDIYKPGHVLKKIEYLLDKLGINKGIHFGKIFRGGTKTGVFSSCTHAGRKLIKVFCNRRG